jgi:hypothetical protein
MGVVFRHTGIDQGANDPTRRAARDGASGRCCEPTGSDDRSDSRNG